MIINLLFAFGLMVATVIIHGFGTFEAMANLSRVWQRKARLTQSPFVRLMHVLRVVSLLLLLHLVEAGIWAGFYLASGALPELETAAYFSLTSYTTLGYGDVVLPARWRLLGPFEGAVGILMFGWSTGIMVAALSTIYGSYLRQLDQ